METDDKSFEFDFFLLDYANSFQSTYAYKIEGYDQKWTNLSTNQLRINRLPYGDYILKVKAKGSKETWSNQVLELPINVLRPFYLTWQFILVGLIALLALGYMIIQWRLKILENRNLELERVVAERTKELEQNSKELAQNAEVLAQNSKELADLNQTKDQFFAIIAHDMRGLVLSFKNVSQKVGFLRRKGREKEVDVFLKNIDKSADNLSNLLDNLLNWALVEKGVFPYHPELFNLERVVMENIKLFTELSRIKDIPLSYEVHETLNVYADKNAVSTIIRNLMNNAIKYSSPGAAVIIKAHQVDGKIQIEIKDTGEGIESEALEKIFQLDTQKTKQGTLGEKGTGLGLVLCKELVMLNKGDINIKSEEGKGTSVFVGLPMVA